MAPKFFFLFVIVFWSLTVFLAYYRALATVIKKIDKVYLKTELLFEKIIIIKEIYLLKNTKNIIFKKIQKK